MSALISTLFRNSTRFALIVLVFPLLAHAGLPQSANVPGGVAVIPLGSVSSNGDMPQAWFDEQPVLVTADHDQWHAVIGLPLSTAPGSYQLLVNFSNVTIRQDFVVNPKNYPEQRITLKDKSKVQLSKKDLARANREIAVIKKLKLHWRAAPDTDLDFILPAEGRLSGDFGLRRIFNGEPRMPHAGIDVALATGTPVMASARGQVLAVDDYFFNGKTIFIDHGNGLITLYCHLDRIDVNAGDMVGKGQQIGLSGSTGRATGPHLHWSVILNGAMVDPGLFVPAKQDQ